MPTAQLSEHTSTQLDPATPRSRVIADSAPVAPGYAEQITEIAGRLRRRYPSEQISSADLDGRVRGFHRQFDTARVRTYVAVFVERLVRSSIEQPPARAAGAGATQPQG